MTRIASYSCMVPFVFVTFTGCGGSESPPPKTAEPVSESVESASVAEAESAPAEKDEATQAAAEPKEEEGLSGGRTPKDMLTAPDVLFMFSWSQSEPARAAEEACNSKHEGNAQVRAECVAKAKKKFVIDGVRLTKDADGKFWWVAFVRKGNSLQAINSFQVEFGEETKTSIVLKPTGRDKGSKPLRQLPKEILIKTPNDYSIVIEDPEGSMVYEAKLGLSEAQK